MGSQTRSQLPPPGCLPGLTVPGSTFPSFSVDLHTSTWEPGLQMMDSQVLLASCPLGRCGVF